MLFELEYYINSGATKALLLFGILIAEFLVENPLLEEEIRAPFPLFTYYICDC